MTITENAVNRDPITRIDEQLQNLDGHVQDLLGKGGVPQPVQAQEIPRLPDGPSQKPSLPPLAAPSPPRRSIGIRLVRPAVGIGLLVLAAWALLPLIFGLQSTQAVVNAPLVTLRSPIDGTVRFLGPTASGASANNGAPLFEISNTLADEDGLDSLKDEQALLEASIAGFREQLQGLSNLRESLSASARKYQEARLRTLELEREGAKAGLEERSGRGKTAQRRERANRPASGQSQCKQLRCRSDSIRRCSGAPRGNSGPDRRRKRRGANPRPPRRRPNRPGRRPKRPSLFDPATSRNRLPHRGGAGGAATGRGETGPARTTHPSGDSTTLAPRAVYANGPFRSPCLARHVSSDTAIKADSPLLDLVNPSEVFIDAVIYEHDLSRVKLGDTARVRLPGSGKEWKAVVKQVFAHSLPWPDRLLATETVSTRKEESHVILRLQRAADGRRGRHAGSRRASGRGDLSFPGATHC